MWNLATKLIVAGLSGLIVGTGGTLIATRKSRAVGSAILDAAAKVEAAAAKEAAAA